MGKLTKFVLTVCFIFCAALASAQSLFMGVKAGISVPNLTAGGSNPVSAGYSSILGPYFGIFSELRLKPHFSIQMELNYDAQGGKKNGVQAIPSAEFAPYFPPGFNAPPYFYASFDSKARLNYLELPILAKFSVPLGGHWKFVIDAGPYVACLLNAKTVTVDSSDVYYDPQEKQDVGVGKQDFSSNENITSDVHRFNVGVQGGVGLQLALGTSRFLYFHVGGNYGFLNIQKYAEDGSNQTGAATIAIGYAVKMR
jgi:hypothetical protein